jgi:hypothetical protein
MDHSVQQWLLTPTVSTRPAGVTLWLDWGLYDYRKLYRWIYNFETLETLCESCSQNPSCRLVGVLELTARLQFEWIAL